MLRAKYCGRECGECYGICMHHRVRHIFLSTNLGLDHLRRLGWNPWPGRVFCHGLFSHTHEPYMDSW